MKTSVPIYCVTSLQGGNSFIMRNLTSKPTILEHMVKDFKKGFTGDYGIKLNPRKLFTLYTLDWWSSFVVCWHSVKALNVPIIPVVYRIVTGDTVHPNQFPCIEQWLKLPTYGLPRFSSE